MRAWCRGLSFSTSVRCVARVVPLLLGVAPLAAQAPVRAPVPLRDIRLLGRLADPALDESSALVRSTVTPGRWWTLNDSGGEAMLFALDSTGRALGTLRIANARNRDWESLATGPCAATGSASRCLYIGDTGDNEARHRAIHVYRVAEPSRLDGRATVRADRFVIRYADGPHDVEAMVVGPDASLHFFTKRDSAVRHYRVPGTRLVPADTAVAEFVETLPIKRTWVGGAMVTDGALRADNAMLALRTYTQVFLVPVDPVTLQWTRAQVTVCDLGRVAGDERLKGESISFLASPDQVLLGTEGAEGTLHAARCGVPRR
jgi:hypothetical protein